jgi:DNA-binding HxlR family transcriptional regulator
MASSIFIGRWTPQISFSLRYRPYRHVQLRRQLGSVSQRMLTRTLRNLESAGLIARRVTQSKVITVEYLLANWEGQSSLHSEACAAGQSDIAKTSALTCDFGKLKQGKHANFVLGGLIRR